jgi:prephenate dehydrogenase
MAGSERRGFENADPDLFEGRITVVTPLEDTSRDDLSRLKSFWASLGSAVIELSPEAHDRAVAEISHVPHIVAAVLASTLSEANRSLAATGFRDTTRIAAGDPRLWSPILLSNLDEVIHSLDAFTKALGCFRKALAGRDDDALTQLLSEAKTKRDALG